MTKSMTESESAKPNPDQKYLEALRRAEIADLERSIAEENELSRRRQARIEHWVKAIGLRQSDIAERLEECADLSNARQH